MSALAIALFRECSELHCSRAMHSFQGSTDWNHGMSSSQAVLLQNNGYSWNRVRVPEEARQIPDYYVSSTLSI